MTDDQRNRPHPRDDVPVDAARRKSLKQIGGLAASVAPAMVVLVKAQNASAHHNGRPGRPDQPGHEGGPPCWQFGGNGGGNGNGNGNGNNPHSAC